MKTLVAAPEDDHRRTLLWQLRSLIQAFIVKRAS